MSFPLSYLLIPYLIFLGIWFILSLIAVYHILRFGGKVVGGMLLTVMYVSGAITLAVLSYTYIIDIDWRNEASFFSSPGSLPSFEIPR